MRPRLALLLFLAACPDDGEDPCTGLATPSPASAALVSAGGESFTYGGFRSVLAGDCPTDSNPRGSMTIDGAQEGSGFPLVICVRDENAVKSGQAIQLADAEALLISDVSARDAAGCTYSKDSGDPDFMGTLVFQGYCTEIGAVYDMTLAGSVAAVKTCEGLGSEMVRLDLAGTVAVSMEDGL
jgi:hypothetical protein